jgi:hypothetical protein
MKNIVYIISFGVIAYLLFVGFKSLKSFANAPARDTKANSNEVIGCFSEENFKLVYKYLLWKKSVAKKLSPNRRVIVTANLLTVIDVETSEDERGKYIQFFKNNEYYFKVDAQKGVIPIFIKQKTSYVEDCQKIFCDLLERANIAKHNLEKFRMDNKTVIKSSNKMTGVISKIPMLNKAGRVCGTDYYFKTEKKEYFIKLADSKITRDSLDMNIGKSVEIEYDVFEYGQWDSNDPRAQSRMGEYITVLKLAKI